MPDRLPFPGESWDNVGSNLHRGAIRSVCGSVPRNGCFRGYHTNTARGESKTPISRNRGEIGGKAREHIPRELIERDSKNGFYLGRRFDRRKWRDVPILETRTHNPKVVGSTAAIGSLLSRLARGSRLPEGPNVLLRSKNPRSLDASESGSWAAALAAVNVNNKNNKKDLFIRNILGRPFRPLFHAAKLPRIREKLC